MKTRFSLKLALLCAGTLCAAAPYGAAQRAATTPAEPNLTLGSLVEHLPEHVSPANPLQISMVAEEATASERDNAIPQLIRWTSDERLRVRQNAMMLLGLLYLPGAKRPAHSPYASLPVQYLPTIAAHLRDPDLILRRGAFLALQPTELSGSGLQELIHLVLPMLREPDVLVQAPDPFFIESQQAHSCANERRTTGKV
ncbi:MAG: hypothetical protein PW792_01090 [Acidobacteriaceae bacterium]|nr:hypothetical protein [Acidobacteriaceae bacterium]